METWRWCRLSIRGHTGRHPGPYGATSAWRSKREYAGCLDIQNRGSVNGAKKGVSQGGGHMSLIFWASWRSRLAEGGNTDLLFQSPLDGADENGWRENGLCSGGFLRSMNVREGVCLDIFISWSIGDGE